MCACVLVCMHVCVWCAIKFSWLLFFVPVCWCACARSRVLSIRVCVCVCACLGSVVGWNFSMKVFLLFGAMCSHPSGILALPDWRLYIALNKKKTKLHIYIYIYIYIYIGKSGESTSRECGKLDILQISLVRHLDDLGNCIWTCGIVPHFYQIIAKLTMVY